MYPLGENFIFKVAPRFSGAAAAKQRAIVSAIAARFAAILARYGISTHLRIAHFMAQVTHECAGFRTTEEFATGDAYEGRVDLGNLRAGDGRRYKGRGLIQLTGRANYRQMGKLLGLDLESDPHLAADPITSLQIACEYWKSRKINIAADADDLVRVTRLVNGGLNGLDDRRRYLQRAKAALIELKAGGTEGGAIPPADATDEPGPFVLGWLLLNPRDDFKPRRNRQSLSLRGSHGLPSQHIRGHCRIACSRRTARTCPNRDS